MSGSIQEVTTRPVRIACPTVPCLSQKKLNIIHSAKADTDTDTRVSATALPVHLYRRAKIYSNLHGWWKTTWQCTVELQWLKLAGAMKISLSQM